MYKDEKLSNNASCMQTISCVVYLSVYNHDVVLLYTTAAQHSTDIGPTFLFSAMYFQVYSKTTNRLQCVSLFPAVFCSSHFYK